MVAIQFSKIMKHTVQQEEMTYYQKQEQSLALVPKVAGMQIPELPNRDLKTTMVL